ncbi:MAG: PorT family protein [Bacteroidales bacterium]|nr:PorT family protein [Bacteroidales bacterium]
MRSKTLFITLAIALLCLPCSHKLHSQVIISLLFGEELNSDQVKFGLDGGFNFSNMTGTEGAKFLENFNLGLYFDIQLKENSNWFLHTGALLKSDMGATGIELYSLDESYLDSSFIGGSIERTLKYINIPALVRYRFTNHFFIELGPMLGVLTKATDEFYNIVQKDEDLSLLIKVTDQYKWFDAGLQAGLGYHLLKGTGVNFGVRYYQGLMDVKKDNSSDPLWNQAVYLFVSVPVGAGEKAKAKKAEKADKKNS